MAGVEHRRCPLKIKIYIIRQSCITKYYKSMTLYPMSHFMCHILIYFYIYSPFLYIFLYILSFYTFFVHSYMPIYVFICHYIFILFSYYFHTFFFFILFLQIPLNLCPLHIPMTQVKTCHHSKHVTILIMQKLLPFGRSNS